IDQDALIEPLRVVLPPVVVAKRGRKGLTVFYRCEEQLQKRNYRTADKDGLGDFLGHGSQTVLPPSIHPDTGKPYEWPTTATLLNTPLAALPLFTREHHAAMEAVFAQHGWIDPERTSERREPAERPARLHNAVVVDSDFDAVVTRARDRWVPLLGLHRLRRV